MHYAAAFLKEKQAYGKQIMKGALTNAAALPKTKQLHKGTLQLRKEDIGLAGCPAFRGAFEAAVEACAAAREAERVEREMAAATATDARRSTKRVRVPSPQKKRRAAANKDNRSGNQRRVGRAKGTGGECAASDPPAVAVATSGCGRRVRTPFGGL